MISGYEKQETVNDELKSKFIKMTIVQFINISIVVLLVNFDFFDTPLLGFIPFLNGNYTSFDQRFYANIGKTIQSALVIQIILPSLRKIIAPAE